jgi:hypothetical protein
MTRQLSLLLCLFLLLSSCGEDFSNELQQIANLEERTRVVEESFKSWNLSEMNAENSRISGMVEKVNALTKEKGLTLSKEEYNLLADYKSATKAYKNLREIVPLITADIEKSKKQLKALRADIDNKILSKELAAKHLADESTATEVLEQEIGKVEKGFSKSQDRVKNLEGKVTAMIARLSL